MRAVFISLLLLLSLIPSIAQNQDATKSQSGTASSTQMLNQRILRAYESLSVARELLKFERMEALPIGTLVTWVGNFPNRKGVKITKFSVTQSTTPGGIERAEEKSILLEFNGSTLSKVVSEIKTANYSAEDTIMIRMTDTTPLDNNVDDLVIYADKNGKEAEYPLNYLPDEGVNRDRSEFKKEFYLKLIEDFFVHVLRLQEMQSQHSSRNQKKLLQSYKESLEY
ncbi:endostatin-like outer membrane lipoprotein LenA [Leptospira venezuelensis]|uniref:endostatin-like outer membrane lipoprotein LenA n=1 Tax=Leptospira venezuelensis TaxID=1958811 RepID=UPI000A374B8B